MKIHQTQQIEYDDGSLGPAFTTTVIVPESQLMLDVAVRSHEQAEQWYERNDHTIVVKKLPLVLAFVPRFMFDPSIETITIFTELSPELEPYWTPGLGQLQGGTLDLHTMFYECGGTVSFRAVSNQGAMSRKVEFDLVVQPNLPPN